MINDCCKGVEKKNNNQMKRLLFASHNYHLSHFCSRSHCRIWYQSTKLPMRSMRISCVHINAKKKKKTNAHARALCLMHAKLWENIQASLKCTHEHKKNHTMKNTWRHQQQQQKRCMLNILQCYLNWSRFKLGVKICIEQTGNSLCV